MVRPPNFFVANGGGFFYKKCMGYVFNAEDAQHYQRWLSDEHNRLALELETGLMRSMLRPVFGESLLDVGCGTGESLRPYLGKGISLTGIDPSDPMIAIARENLGHRVDFHRGYAEDLPFEDNAFNHVSLFLTLEFVDDPVEALAEACRVAKDSVFIGILNRHSAYVTRLQARRLVRSSIYDNARFYSVREVRKILFSLLGQVPVFWRTVLQLPFTPPGICHRLESSGYLGKCPFGGFAGIHAIPVPRFQAMPLSLKTMVEQNAAAGNRVASCSRYHKEKRQSQPENAKNNATRK